MIPLWFLLEIPVALVLNVLHFWMKGKLLGAGLPVVWFMWPTDDWRMWNTYRREAPSRNWPVWPFFVYRSLLGVFAAVALVGVGFWWP
jgi:hypothetical protein